MNSPHNYTLEKWLIQLSEIGAISESTSQALRYYDSRKDERLLFLHNAIGLPIIKAKKVLFNGSDSAPEIRKWLEKQSCELFSLRAQPIDPNRGDRQRVHGVSKMDALRYVTKLEAERVLYEVSISPYYVPEVSGHIIVAKTGITVEAGRCPLMSISQQWVSSDVLVGGSLQFPKHGMVYTTEDVEMRKIIWGAVRHLINQRHSVISPLHFPEVVLGYFEFIFVSSEGYFFFDFNQSKLLLSPPEGGGGIEVIENEFPIPEVHQFPSYCRRSSSSYQV